MVIKGERLVEKPILDIKTHYRPTETFQYTHFSSCHPPGVKSGFIKGEAMRLLRANSSKTTFEECLANFKQARGYPKKYIDKVTFDSRQSALKQQKQTTVERLLPFVTTYHLAVKEQIAMENQPLLKTIFQKPPIISYKKGKSLKRHACESKTII